MDKISSTFIIPNNKIILAKGLKHILASMHGEWTKYMFTEQREQEQTLLPNVDRCQISK